jgi:hypothetical protein
MENHKVFHISLLEPCILGHLEVNLEKIRDTPDPIEADNKDHIKEVMGSIETKDKVSVLVK